MKRFDREHEGGTEIDVQRAKSGARRRRLDDDRRDWARLEAELHDAIGVVRNVARATADRERVQALHRALAMLWATVDLLDQAGRGCVTAVTTL